MRFRTFICEFCNTKFDRRNGKRVYRFCSQSCAQKCLSKTQRTYEALYARWLKRYGVDEAQRRLKENMHKRSEATRRCNLGRQLSTETKQKISQSCVGIPNAIKGKTFEEFYGHDRGSELARQHSQKLKDGYASGKLNPTARSKSAPTFRGIKLRSKLEQGAIEFLEARDGLDLNETLIYEDPKTRVQWIDDTGVSHTYQPDLHDLVNDIVYEVKPAWLVENPTQEMLLKQRAIETHCSSFRYLTDKDIKKDAR